MITIFCVLVIFEGVTFYLLRCLGLWIFVWYSWHRFFLLICSILFLSCIWPVFLPPHSSIRVRVVRLVLVLWAVFVYLGKCQTTPPFLGVWYYAAVSQFLYVIFLWFFIFFIFRLSLMSLVLILPSIYPLFCPTIAQNTFCVQLVTRGNFKRLEQKYDGFCVLRLILCIFCTWFVVKC